MCVCVCVCVCVCAHIVTVTVIVHIVWLSEYCAWHGGSVGDVVSAWMHISVHVFHKHSLNVKCNDRI